MKEKKSLLNGHMLTCPRCKKEHSIESYLKLVESEQFKYETVPIYKCSDCKWIFALNVDPNWYEKLTELLSSNGSVAETEAKVK